VEAKRWTYPRTPEPGTDCVYKDGSLALELRLARDGVHARFRYTLARPQP
jgi:hypothetical protein